MFLLSRRILTPIINNSRFTHNCKELEILELINMNNMVSGIARCWEIPIPKFNYKDSSQKYDVLKIKEDRNNIFILQKHPVFIQNKYFIHPSNIKY